MTIGPYSKLEGGTADRMYDLIKAYGSIKSQGDAWVATGADLTDPVNILLGMNPGIGISIAAGILVYASDGVSLQMRAMTPKIATLLAVSGKLRRYTGGFWSGVPPVIVPGASLQRPENFVMDAAIGAEMQAGQLVPSQFGLDGQPIEVVARPADGSFVKPRNPSDAGSVG